MAAPGAALRAGPNERVLGRFRMYGTTKSARGFRKQFAEDYEVARKHAPDERWLLALHRFNNAKIVTIYYLMAFLDRFRRRSAAGAGMQQEPGGTR